MNDPTRNDVLGPMTWHLTGLAVILLSVAAGVWLQNEVLLVPALGWLIRSVTLMADGQRFGIDLFELNLPVMWYLCRPAAWFVEYLGLGEVAAIRLWVWILAAVSLVATFAGISRAGVRSSQLLVEFSIAAIAACVLAGAGFGQREHLAFLLSLPYLFCVRLRTVGKLMPSPPAVIAGVLAGVAFSIKPYFLAVPVAVELSLFVIRRGAWNLIRPETLALAIAGCLSLVASLLLAPDYLDQVVPLARATYWAYDNPIGFVLFHYPVAIGVLFAWILVIFVDRRVASEAIVWFGAWLGWTASYFIQGKGFDYHAYPVTAAAFLLSVGLFAVLARRLREVAREWSVARALNWNNLKIAGATVAMLIASQSLTDDTVRWFQANTLRGWPLSNAFVRQDLIRLLERLGVGRGDAVLVFSTNPYPAFPTLNYLGADWVGPDMAQFLLPAWLRKDEVTDARQREAIDAAMTVQREHVRRAMLGSEPDFILVSRPSRSGSPQGAGMRYIDYFAVFGSDPALAAAFARYTRIAVHGSVQVYARDAGSKPPESH